MPLNKLLPIAKATLMLTALGLAAFWCLSTTLDDMTQKDCNRGVIAACKQLGQ